VPERLSIHHNARLSRARGRSERSVADGRTDTAEKRRARPSRPRAGGSSGTRSAHERPALRSRGRTGDARASLVQNVTQVRACTEKVRHRVVLAAEKLGEAGGEIARVVRHHGEDPLTRSRGLAGRARSPAGARTRRGLADPTPTIAAHAAPSAAQRERPSRRPPSPDPDSRRTVSIIHCWETGCRPSPRCGYDTRPPPVPPRSRRAARALTAGNAARASGRPTRGDDPSTRPRLGLPSSKAEHARPPGRPPPRARSPSGARLRTGM
jgi:hypothetical protein